MFGEKYMQFLFAFSLLKIKHWIRIGIRIRIGFKTLDPDPHEMDADPKHWLIKGDIS